MAGPVGGILVEPVWASPPKLMVNQLGRESPLDARSAGFSDPLT